MLLLFVLPFAFSLAAFGQAQDKPSHDRPYFMPEWKRQELRELIETAQWARKSYEEIESAAANGNGFWAAFIYAFEGKEKYVPAARDWLLETAKSWINDPGQKLRNPDYWKGGMPHLASVYYDLDYKPYVAYDWIYKALETETRKKIRNGIWHKAEYKKRCMTRWVQTPNLMFKPTFMVAMAGMAIQDEDLLKWGFRRKPGGKWNVRNRSRGGYFVAIDAMLKDGGPWHEAPIYPILHRDLYCMGVMSFYRELYDGKDWWSHRSSNGGSPEGLMDYYLNSAYPPENVGDGEIAYRCATYGDGATGTHTTQSGYDTDLFLVREDGGGEGPRIHEALRHAYRASDADPRYAPFVKRIPEYSPHLWLRPEVPDKAAFPPAPSTVWPDYGLAMLRSDESQSYWRNEDALAVFQIMSKGYGHDHRDKFSLTLYGAGHLLYPDYNAIQYENLAIGWTRNTVSHCTLMVDAKDTRPRQPTIRHELTPEVKYLATSASGVFEAVEQTRVLMLTGEYLLDVFQADSPVPRMYDYTLHSFGQPRPADSNAFENDAPPGRCASAMVETRTMHTEAAWNLDFVIAHDGNEQAGVRMRMAEDGPTQAYIGHWGGALKDRVQRDGDRKLDPLGVLVARREKRRRTAFVATHEPYRPGEKTLVQSLTRVAQTPQAAVVRVEADGFTDYAAVSFGPQNGEPEHRLLSEDGEQFAFKDYGYLRLSPDGQVVARGGWTGFRISANHDRLTLNGRATEVRQEGGILVYGEPPRETSEADPAIAPPFTVSEPADVIRCGKPGSRQAAFVLTSKARKTISGHLELTLPEGLSVEPNKPEFGPLAPGEQTRISVTFTADEQASAGEHIVPYRFVLGEEGKVSKALAARISVGPALSYVYPDDRRPYFDIKAPLYRAKADMFHGMPRYLKDDQGTVRLAWTPLFTFSIDGQQLLFEHADHAFTWPDRAPAQVLAHALDQARWHARYEADRIVVWMEPSYSPTGKADFVVPGKWVSPGGEPKWTKVIAVDPGGNEVEARPGTDLNISAVELAFPKGNWNLAFEFEPAQPVVFDGTGLKFSIRNQVKETFAIGFCEPSKLEAWRKRAD